MARSGRPTIPVTPDAFFQVNRHLLQPLYEYVRDAARVAPALALDAFGGVGLFAGRFLDSAIGSSRSNRRIAVASPSGRGIAVRRETGRLEDRSRQCFRSCERAETFDLAIVDPPRAGLGKKLAALLADRVRKQIVYVSCEPATLARPCRALRQRLRDRGVEAVRSLCVHPSRRSGRRPGATGREMKARSRNPGALRRRPRRLLVRRDLPRRLVGDRGALAALLAAVCGLGLLWGRARRNSFAGALMFTWSSFLRPDSFPASAASRRRRSRRPPLFRGFRRIGTGQTGSRASSPTSGADLRPGLTDAFAPSGYGGRDAGDDFRRTCSCSSRERNRSLASADGETAASSPPGPGTSRLRHIPTLPFLSNVGQDLVRRSGRTLLPGWPPRTSGLSSAPDPGARDLEFDRNERRSPHFCSDEPRTRPEGHHFRAGVSHLSSSALTWRRSRASPFAPRLTTERKGGTDAYFAGVVAFVSSRRQPARRSGGSRLRHHLLARLIERHFRRAKPCLSALVLGRSLPGLVCGRSGRSRPFVDCGRGPTGRAAGRDFLGFCRALAAGSDRRADLWRFVLRSRVADRARHGAAAAALIACGAVLLASYASAFRWRPETLF